MAIFFPCPHVVEKEKGRENEETRRGKGRARKMEEERTRVPLPLLRGKLTPSWRPHFHLFPGIQFTLKCPTSGYRPVGLTLWGHKCYRNTSKNVVIRKRQKLFQNFN